MLSFGVGETAALVTALSWAGSCQIHTMAGRMIGAVNVTTARVPLYIMGIGMVAFFSGATAGLPSGAAVFIVISAIFGITLCDPLLYSASVTIGPRLAVLLQSLSACLTAILGHFFLDETINLTGWMGIIMASSGVAFVLMEGGVKSGADFSGLTPVQKWRGIAMAFCSAVSMALSFLALKQALRLGMHPFFATFVRMCIGGAILWGIMLMRGRLFSCLKNAWTSWPVMRMLIFGCCVATVGNCLSAFAMKTIQAGIAATLIGLQPIMMIAVTTVVDRKPPTMRAIIGTVIAFTGTALIFTR